VHPSRAPLGLDGTVIQMLPASREQNRPLGSPRLYLRVSLLAWRHCASAQAIRTVQI